jgi:hypothetical protein
LLGLSPRLIASSSEDTSRPTATAATSPTIRMNSHEISANTAPTAPYLSA